MSFKRFDPEDVVVGTEIVSTPTWTGASGEVSTLKQFYTSSKQAGGYTGQFYLDVYSTNPDQDVDYQIGTPVENGSAVFRGSNPVENSSDTPRYITSLSEYAKVQFSIAYADKTGKGAPPYTLPISHENNESMGDLLQKSPSSTVFGQYRSLVLGDEDSDFKFNGGEGDISENFFAISIDRARFKEKLIPGTLQLTLKPASASYATLSEALKGLGVNGSSLPTDLTVANAGLKPLDTASIDPSDPDINSSIDPEYTSSVAIVIRDDSSKNQSVQHIDSGRVYTLKAYVSITGENFEDEPCTKTVTRDILEEKPEAGVCDVPVQDDPYSYYRVNSQNKVYAETPTRLNRWCYGKSCGFFLPDIGVILLDVQALRTLGVLNQDPREYAEYVEWMTEDNVDVFDTNVSSPMEMLYKQLEEFTVMSQETVTSNYIFVRARNAEFNYSTNPSNITGSGELRHDVMINSPEAFITTVGLYNDSGDLLSVAKLSRPLPKSFGREALIRIKLDF